MIVLHMREYLINKEPENQLEKSRIDGLQIAASFNRSKLLDDRNNTLIKGDKISQNSMSRISDAINNKDNKIK